MLSQIRTSAFLLTTVTAAALIGGHTDRYALAMLAFGAFNALAALRGTAGVRAVAALWASGALLLPDSGTRTAVAILAWLVWPPAFLVAWATTRGKDKADVQQGGGEPDAGFGPRSAMAILIAVVAVAFMYRLLLNNGLHQTSALFVGLPALLAIGVVFGVSPRSGVGVACKATTVGMLVSLMFLGEGVVCVLMSAPLFYLVAVIVGKGVDLTRGGPGTAQRTVSCVAVLALIPMSFEGVAPGTSFNRDEWVTETRIVDAPAEAVGRAMFEAPRFDRVLPVYLAAGFPRPTATRIERADGAARWVIRFRGGEMRIDGIEPRSGDLVLEIAEERPGFVRWRALSDDSHMTHYLQWRESRVRWEPVDAGRTRVTWTLRYRRGLDPAWYFGPWERYAVGLAAGYLIESVATP